MDDEPTQATALSLDQLAERETLTPWEQSLLNSVLQDYPTLTPEKALQHLRLAGM